jgi:hypothetical protein
MKQHTFIKGDFERMLDEAFQEGRRLRLEWQLATNNYKGEDTDANRMLMEAFIHGVIGREKLGGGKE